MPKNYIYNNTGSIITIGNISIPTLSKYMFYDSDRNMFGSYIQDFIASFSNPNGINKMMFTGDLKYYIDNTESTTSLFFSNWHTFKILLPSNYPNNRNYRIYNYVSVDNKVLDPTKAPFALDFKKQLNIELQPVWTYKKGLVVKTEYFADVNKTIPVVKSEFIYNVDSSGYVSQKTETISWTYDNDGYSTDTKVLTRNVDIAEAMVMGDERRSVILNKAKVDMIGLLLQTAGGKVSNAVQAKSATLPLLNELESEINKYVKVNINPLIVKFSTINPATLGDPYNLGNWLDNQIVAANISIRTYVLSMLNEGDFSASEIVKL